MLSRVADSLYWMSRYMERNGGIIRTLKANYALSQESTGIPSHGDSRGSLHYMVSDLQNECSIINNIVRARENARSAQDHITKELWQCLNQFYHFIKKENLKELLQHEDPITVLENINGYSVMYYGTIDMTMMRGEGYCFMNIGKYIERSLQVADILSLNSNEDYRLKERQKLLEDMILNENFPRSIIYSINRLQRYFERLRSEKNTDAFNKINFMIGKLHSRVRYSTSESIMSQGLHPYLLRLREDLHNIANALDQYYFSHTL